MIGDRMDIGGIVSRIKSPFDTGPDYDRGRYKSGWHILLCALAVVLAILSFMRMFDNCFWGDEIYSINISKKSFPEIVDYCFSHDANPFLYYMLLRVICLIFGWVPFSYHFSAMLPYIGMLILSVTVIYKAFGKNASVTFIALSSFLTSALLFIPEARMYEMGAFMMLASYLSLYFVLKEGKTLHYVLFFVSTICAGLTHYYCLVAAAFLYLVLILDLLIRHRENINRRIKYLLLLVIVAACFCAPIFYERFKTVTGDFWITKYMSFDEAVDYLFCCDRSSILLMIFVVVIIITLARQFWNNGNRKSGFVKFIRNIDHETVWVIAGLLSVFGTIGVGLYISENFTPILIERYLFPITLIAWLLLAFGLSRCDIIRTVKGLLPFAVALCILLAGIPGYGMITDEERSNEASQNAIMDITTPYVDDGYIILTDIGHFDINVLDYYYPGNTHMFIKDYKVPTLDHSKKYLLYVEYYIHWKISVNLESQGYTTEELTHGKFATMYTLYVYELVPI